MRLLDNLLALSGNMSISALWHGLSVGQTALIFNASLPNVTIFATGGTIAGQGASTTNNNAYEVSASINVLIGAVPEMLDYANVASYQISEVVSENINQTILLELHRLISVEVNKPSVAGVVLTHGTNTLEETCFFLELTVRTSKPIVCTAAMRPSTAVSADGPANLLQSVILASAPNARDRGVMVSLNDKIGSSVYAIKNHANNPDSFFSTDAGTLGYYLDHIPFFYYTPARPIGIPFFDISAADSLPQVDILHSHQDQNPVLVHAAVVSGAKGIVFAGNGDGAIPEKVFKTAEACHKTTGISFIRSHKVPYGWANTDRFLIGSAHLNPVKARILLQLAIYEDMSNDKIRKLFDALRPSRWV